MGALRELALFAGAGGGILGGHLLGWRCVCAVEIEDYARAVLLSRQRDGLLPVFPVWDDVRTFDGRPWRGAVDIVTGGFPCQDISVAGKGAGIDGARSGLWAEMARIIGEVQPRFALVENSPALVGRGLGRVLGDLAALGYGARYGIFSARMAGAPHLRERVWVLAHANEERCEERFAAAESSIQGFAGGRLVPLAHPKSIGWESRRPNHAEKGESRRKPDRSDLEAPLGYANSQRKQQQKGIVAKKRRRARYTGARGWWRFDPATAGRAEPRVGRVAYGVDHRVDRLTALGNGQVPAVVALAWRSLGGPALAAKER